MSDDSEDPLGPSKDHNERTGAFAKEHLKAFVERIERLDEEQRALADDKKDVYGEAKAMGFDAKAIRKLVQIRRQDPDQRAEQDAILETYMRALGMLK